MEEQAKKIADLLKVLANENRLLILCALLDGPLTVNKINDKVPNITQSALSQHLNLLRANGILDYNKKGLNVIYFICDNRIEDVLGVIKNNYCRVDNHAFA